MSGPCISRATSRGFTLIELVVVIVLTSIVVGFATMFMTTPVEAYFAQSRRSQLTETSAAITRHLSEDLRAALPNSVRISNVGTRSIVELLLVKEVAFYRTGGSVDPDSLLTSGGDARFTSVGQFSPGPPLPARPLNVQAGWRLAIGNLGSALADAYSVGNVMTPRTTTIKLKPGPIAGEDSIELSAPFNFTSLSPSNRMFLVSGPVTYVCNTATQTLRRYQDYATGAMPASEADPRFSAAGVTATIIGADVTACRLACRAATAAPCEESITVDMAVTRAADAGAETVRVFIQERVENIP